MSAAVELCQKLIGFKTDDGATRPALEFLLSELETMGFRGKIIDFYAPDGQRVSNLFATFGNSGRHLLFSGHMDVVPAGNPADWKHPPYDAVIDQDVLYGRGVADMKGGIACFAAAVKEYLSGAANLGRISILISGDEEEPLVDGTDKMLALLTDEGYKFDFCLVGEPTNTQQIGDEIKIGRRGDVVLKITSFGEAGHTAYPQLAVNPIHNLALLLSKMISAPLDQGNDFFGPSTLQITTVDVGNKASNVIPAEAYAQIDIRFNNLHTGASLTQWAARLIESTSGKFDLKAEVAGEAFLSPLCQEADMLKEAIEKICGQTPAFSTKGGTSDARFVRKYCPVVEFGLTNGNIHKINERETTANLDKLTAVYLEFLRLFFA